MPRNRLRTAVLVGTAAIMLTLLAGMSWLLSRTWDTTLDNASATLERSARLAESIVNRQMLQVDGAIASLPALLGGEMRGATVTPEMAGRLLQGMNFQTFAFRDVIIVRDDGTVWASGRPRHRSRQLPLDAEQLKELAGSNGPRVIGPSRNPMTGDWVIFLHRPLALPGTRGLSVLAEIPVSSLTSQLDSLVQSAGSRLVIEHSDGRVLAVLPHDELVMGRTEAASPLATDGRAVTLWNESGRVAALSAARPTLYADVRIRLTTSIAAATADWRRDRDHLAIVMSGAVLLLLGLAGVLILALRRQERLEAERQQAQARLEDAIEAMTDGFVMWDGEDRLVTFNRRYRELYEESASVLVPGTQFADIIRFGAENGQYPQAGKDIDDFVKRMVAWHQAGQGSFERLLPDGRWVLVTERRTQNGDIVGIRTDITAMKTTVAELAEANARVQETMAELKAQNAALSERDLALRTQNMLFDAAISNMSHGLLMAGPDERIIVCNRRIGDLLGVDAPEDLAGGAFAELFARSRSDDALRTDVFNRQHALANARSAGTFVATASNGTALAVTQRPMPDGGFVALYEDVTEKQRAESRIRFLAHHDPLTRLPNRVVFLNEVDGMMKGLGSADERVALLYLDLDKFKDVNDTLGHPVGDALLERVGDRLRRCLRERDVVARLGGDEFAIAFSAEGAEKIAISLAERIIRAVSAPYDIKGHVVTIGVSVGIAMSDDVSDADTLMRRGDMALYAAKAQGRGTWRVFEPAMQSELHERLETETDLRRAIDRNELRVVYQPLVDLTNSRIVGFEALLRWEHATRGLIGPDRFIPVAEDSGLIREVGAWCLDRACRDIAAASRDVKLSVNLSPVQLRSGAIVDVVRQALTASGLPAQRLELEITENAFLEDDEKIVARLFELHAMGVRIVLDDFGTGYSSLNYLRRFPFHKIKIDKVFVREATSRADSSAIIRSVVELAQRLGMTTTAEGVETEAQLALVRGTGCTEGQGWLFGKPQSILGVLPLLEAERNAGSGSTVAPLRAAG